MVYTRVSYAWKRHLRQRMVNAENERQSSASMKLFPYRLVLDLILITPSWR